MRVTPRLLIPIVLFLSLCSLPVAADPIVVTYTSPSALLAAYPGAVFVGLEEFNDTTLDGNVGVTPTGVFGYGGDALPESYRTTGATTYSLLVAGGAQLFGIGYFPGAAGGPIPSVRFLSGSDWWTVGLLLGVLEGPNSTSHFWGFYSSSPFSAVEINPGTGQPFNADAVGFAQLPVPEPTSTLVLLTIGLLATARGLVRRGRR